VSINNQNIGDSPVSYEYDSSKINAFAVTADLLGYFPEMVTVTAAHPAASSGTLHLVLRKNPAWSVTTTSRATNTWLSIQVDPSITRDAAWQKIVDSVTSKYAVLEQVEPTSGYVRSAVKERQWNTGTSRGVLRVRNQFLGSIQSAKPLTYKFRINSETSSGNSGTWEPYNRVFKEDAQLIEELVIRLGLK
jgi:hypothetical protein